MGRLVYLRRSLQPSLNAFCTVAAPLVIGSIRFISSTARSNFVFFRNRAGLLDGDTASISYVVGHIYDDLLHFVAPTVVWLKDGVLIDTLPTNIERRDGFMNSTLSFIFGASNVGVYQCVFTDPARVTEVFVTDPIRLETGEALLITSIQHTPDSPVLLFFGRGRHWCSSVKSDFDHHHSSCKTSAGGRGRWTLLLDSVD